jgi:hypothetical protein
MTSSNDVDVERLLNRWAASQPPASPSERTTARIQTELTPALYPVRPLPSQPVLALTFLAVFLACSLVLIAILNKAGFHLMTPPQLAWITGMLAGGAMLFSFAMAADMVPGARQPIPFGLVIALSAFSFIAAITLLFPWRTNAAFVSEGWPCALLELVIAMPVVAAFWLLARRGVLFASPRLGAALTGLAVFLALTPLQFQCMFPQAPHLLVWHAGTATMLVGFGACIGWLLAQRRRLL